MRPKLRLLGTTTLGLAAALLFTPPATALDPRQPAGSYLRTAFTVEDGLPSNVVNDIVQTRDGFLMVGTARGLVRFDGRHFASVHLSPDPTRELIVQSLAESPNGDLWVGTRFGVSRISAAAVHRFGTLPATNYHLGRAAGDSVACLRVPERNGLGWNRKWVIPLRRPQLHPARPAPTDLQN
jgi:ligand-binding sensor domain-containing protein